MTSSSQPPSQPVPVTGSSRTQTNAALQQRCGVITEALQLARGHESLEFVASLLAAARQGTLSIRQVIFLLYQAFVARVPVAAEILNTVKHVEESSPEEIHHRFVNSAEFNQGPQSRIRFRTIENAVLAIDVTHTLHYAHNSGIQRVVRSVARELQSQGLNHVLLRFDNQLGQFRCLRADESPWILDWKSRPKRSMRSLGQKNTRVKAWVRRTVGRRLFDSTQSFLQSWREYGRARRRSRTTVVPAAPAGLLEVVFLWNNRLLIPELVAEADRLEPLSSLLANTPISGSMVLFDLIPLRHPEYCCGNIVDGFMRYLTLLRQMDRISCISRAVEEDVSRFLSLVERRRPPPQLATHLLGADFDFGVSPPAADNSDALPLILSVGTIEVRKNHWRMLRGMVKAQQRGCRFRGIFAGNPGWLNENFLAELAYHQERGVSVEVRLSVSDSELSELYRQASFTLYCSLAEGFGLPIVESVAKGVPCVTSDHGCMKEVANLLGGCLLINPESEEEIADAIFRLLHDRSQYESLREEARKSSWLTWGDYARNLYEFVTAEKVEASTGLSRAA